MKFVKSTSILDFFDKVNASKIDYILVRNINNELPYALKIGKDIDLLVKYNDRKKITQFLTENHYKKINHPHKNGIFLYGVKPFEMFINSDNVLIDLNYQLTCRSLNAGEWLPLDQKIQVSAWKNRFFIKNNGLHCFRLGVDDEFVTLVARAIFDKGIFQTTYINEINEYLEKINKQNVIAKLELIFFKYTPLLLEQIQNNEYGSIIENYLSFKEY